MKVSDEENKSQKYGWDQTALISCSLIPYECNNGLLLKLVAEMLIVPLDIEGLRICIIVVQDYQHNRMVLILESNGLQILRCGRLNPGCSSIYKLTKMPEDVILGLDIWFSIAARVNCDKTKAYVTSSILWTFLFV